jgi:hypothetical protein
MPVAPVQLLQERRNLQGSHCSIVIPSRVDMQFQNQNLRQIHDKLFRLQRGGIGAEAPLLAHEPLFVGDCSRRIQGKLLGPRTTLFPDNSVIGAGCKIRRAILDESVTIAHGQLIGYDLEEDRRRYHV